MSGLSDKVSVILMHGMSTKPAEQAWLELWRLCLTGSLAVEHPKLAGRIADDEDLFVSAYWADVIPDHLHQTASEVRAMRDAVEGLLEFRREHGEAMHVPATGWGPEQVARFGVEAVEYVNQFFKDKGRDAAYLREMKKRSEDGSVGHVTVGGVHADPRDGLAIR